MADGVTLTMANNLIATFAATAEGFDFAGAPLDLERLDISTSNGVIHVLDGVMDVSTGTSPI